MQVQPYLYFDGNAEEALEFYRRALGAEILEMVRFSQSPDKSMIPPGAENKIMHANFRLGESTLMASDGGCSGAPLFQGVSLTLVGNSVQEAEKLFHALEEGGQVQMPLAETFFSPRFGMVADRFGVSWMVVVHKKNS